jgi:hypothetical protein
MLTARRVGVPHVAVPNREIGFVRQPQTGHYACMGGSAEPVATLGRQRIVRRLALTLLALLFAACSHPSERAGEAPSAARPTPEQTAHTLNQTMFDAMQLPHGAELIHGPLPAILTSTNNVPGMGDPFLGNLVDDYRTWSVPLPVKTVRNFNFTPVRNGFDGPGTSSGGRLKTSDGTEWLGGSTYPKLPVNVALAELNTAVTDDGHGGSVIRADALSSWTPIMSLESP